MTNSRGKRNIITIDESKCDGCGLCASACAEGAIKIIAGKAKLISESYCDGLGACLGECPQGAILMEEREAAEFDEQAVAKHLSVSGTADHKHVLAQKHGAESQDRLPCGCPGSMTQVLTPAGPSCTDEEHGLESVSRLGQWPVQLKLIPVNAPFFAGKTLVIAADCVPFAYAGFHQKFLAGKALAVGCPKLDDADFYREKLAQIFTAHDIPVIEILYMEVPCCGALVRLVEGALADSGKKIPLTMVKIGIRGNIISNEV